jgi:flagellar biosynthetic protein FlhB
MADDRDESQKTEEPTQKRLADAREKGDIAKSQEVVNWVVIGAGTLVLLAFGGSMARDLEAVMRPFLASPHDIVIDPPSTLKLTKSLALAVLQILAVPFLLLMAAGVSGHLLQQPPVFSPSRLQLKFEKLSPLAGFKRLFGGQAIINLVKGVTKLVIIGAVAIGVLWPAREKAGGLVSLDPALYLPAARDLSLKLLGAVLAVLALMALLDFVYQRHDFIKRQRMTKQEVRDEHRQLEGDPHVKGKIKQVRLERARRRMMARVPEATVVVTNPTHYAVVLLYEQGKTNAPLCVAKGVDALAARIKKVAEEHKVPIVEDAPLARALYASVDLEEEIPPEHYKAVASVIGYVFRLKGMTKALARR